MSANLTTLENALQFRFLGEDRLYTDHEGRRVIVDVEGFGIMRLIRSDSQVLTVRGGGEPQEFIPNFVNGSIVLGLEPGEVWVQVLKGRIEPVPGGSIRTTGNYFGCGWVVGATGEFSVDDRHEPAPAPSDDFPIAFFRSVKGHGKWSIVPAPSLTCQSVDSCVISDQVSLAAHRFKVQNMSAVSVLDSTFADGSVLSAPVASHLNSATITFAVPADNLGLILRKVYDRFHGRQRARVFVDGAFAGWWYEPGEDRTNRWHVSDFGIEAGLTAGKTSVEITIDPPAGVALWSVGVYELFALRYLA